MTRYVLGIDGGATKTLAAIADEAGRVCGIGAGGPSNVDDIGTDWARANIAQAVAAARVDAGLGAAPFDAAFLGLAGIVAPADRAVVHGIAAGLRLALPERVGVDHDCRIALAGGLSGRPGIVVIAGTGSSCYGRTGAGADWRAGGWGSLIGDEGSGYWLGWQALRSAVRAYDGRGPATRLEADVRRVLGLPDMNAIMHRLYVDELSRAEIAALAPLLLAAARADDPPALALLRGGCADLADVSRQSPRGWASRPGSVRWSWSAGWYKTMTCTPKRCAARSASGCRAPAAANRSCRPCSEQRCWPCARPELRSTAPGSRLCVTRRGARAADGAGDTALVGRRRAG